MAALFAWFRTCGSVLEIMTIICIGIYIYYKDYLA